MIRIVAPPLSRDPVSFVHRVEARMLARELVAMGYGVLVTLYKNPQTLNRSDCINLLRLSDTLMVQATHELTSAGIKYAGPSPAVLEQCYDKLSAYRRAEDSGVNCPRTFVALNFSAFGSKVLIKPRRGSDSLGLKICRDGRIPGNRRTHDYLVQPFIEGAEMTVGVLKGKVGVPLHIMRPEGKPYSFLRKNLMWTNKKGVDDQDLGRHIQGIAAQVAESFAINWGARVDFLYERASRKIFFLECDAAPTISESSCFAESLRRGGISREAQIGLLIRD